MNYIDQLGSIRLRLIALIGSDLGVFSNGTAALWVGSPPPELSPVTGVQVTVDAVPETIDKVAMLGGGEAHIVYRWRVKIVDFGGLTSTRLQRISTRLMCCPDIEVVGEVTASTQVYGQLTLSIAHQGFIATDGRAIDPD
jgi:hypothetical protein